MQRPFWLFKPSTLQQILHKGGRINALSELTNVNPPLPTGEASTVMILRRTHLARPLGELSAVRQTGRANAEKQSCATRRNRKQKIILSKASLCKGSWLRSRLKGCFFIFAVATIPPARLTADPPPFAGGRQNNALSDSANAAPSLSAGEASTVMISTSHPLG
jgi:hypothetical protein